jgi:hypothetical protein
MLINGVLYITNTTTILNAHLQRASMMMGPHSTHFAIACRIAWAVAIIQFFGFLARHGFTYGWCLEASAAG